MVGILGFSQGFRERGQELDRKRRDLAQAFSEFKAQNPTATFDEYQSFIDQYTGDGMGSNYLRGGAPSEEVLRGLADQNEKVRQAQEEQRLLESLQRRGQTDGQLRGTADDVLLNMEDDDFDSAYETLIERLGGEEAEEQFGKNRLQSYITPNRLNTLANEQLRARLPEIREYVDMVDSEEVDAKDIAETFNIRNETVLNPIVSRIQELNRKRRQQEAQKNRMAINDALDSAIERGDPNPVESVKELFPSADHESLNGLYQNAQERSNRLQQQEEEKRRSQRLALVRQFKNDVFMNENTPIGAGISAAVRGGNKEEALRLMRDIAQRDLTESEYELAFSEGGLEATYESMLRDMQSTQDQRYAEYEQKQAANSREAAQEYAQENVDRAFNTNDQLFNEQVATLASNLARRFDWSSAVQGAFERAIQSNDILGRLEDGEITPTSAVSEIAADPTFGQVARPVQDRQGEIMEAGNPFPAGTMRENTKLLRDELTSNVASGLESEAQSVENAESLARKEQELAVYQRTIQQVEADLATKLRQFRQSRNIWLKPGDGGWSEQEFSRLQREAERIIAQARNRAAELKVQIEDEKAVQLQSRQEEGQATVDQSGIGGTRSGALRGDTLVQPRTMGGQSSRRGSGDMNIDLTDTPESTSGNRRREGR